MAVTVRRWSSTFSLAPHKRDKDHPPSSWAYDSSVNLFKHDLPKAKELLQKAGFTLPVKFTCYITNTPEDITIAQAIQEQVAEGGFDMQLELLDFATANAKYSNSSTPATKLAIAVSPIRMATPLTF